MSENISPRSDTGGVDDSTFAETPSSSKGSTLKGGKAGKPMLFAPPPRTRSASPRAFKSVAFGLRGITRAQVLAEEGLPRNLDVSGLVQRIAVTLHNMETYKKVATSLFNKHSENGEDGVPRLPLKQLPKIFEHWKIETHAPIFTALLRKQPSVFESCVLPYAISYKDFHDVLLKFLRRVRNKYCDQPLSKAALVRKNSSLFDNEYEEQGRCGKGAFGECFWVQHKTTKERRVVKRLATEDAKIPSEEVIFELNSLQKLDHPNVLRVYEWFERDETYLIVLQAAHGGDVKHVLSHARSENNSRGLEESFVNTLTSQALSALIYIHNKHIIHRDIKPANMLLATPDMSKPHLLLADFGVAEIFEEHQKLSSLVRGTVSYMAPEVFSNEVGPRTDIWALGIVVFELLVGERPWNADNPMAMFAKLRTATLDVSLLRAASASEDAVSFNRKVLALKVEDRPLAHEAQCEPWIKDRQMTPASPLAKGRLARKARESFRDYMGRSYFSKVAMNCIAAQLDTSKIEGLTEIFQTLDSDRDGRLSTAELAAGLAELDVDPDSITQLVDVVDMNRDGQIEYSEFIACLLQTQGRLIEDVILHAFQVMDVNHDGKITLDELRSMLSADGPLVAMLPDGKSVEQVLQEVDVSGDGSISLGEFKEYLLQDPSQYLDPEEPLTETLQRLATEVGRSHEQLEEQASRLERDHWICKVGDLQSLSPADWPRLNLPLKLERVLKAYIGSA